MGPGKSIICIPSHISKYDVKTWVTRYLQGATQSYRPRPTYNMMLETDKLGGAPQDSRKYIGVKRWGFFFPESLFYSSCWKVFVGCRASNSRPAPLFDITDVAFDVYLYQHVS